MNKEYNDIPNQPVRKTSWENRIEKSTTYFSENTFRFLNIEHQFESAIDWNYAKYGKLWTYNLNYFDFLNQAKIDQKVALSLMYDFVDREEELKDGLEPYPISLRLMNWIKYLSKEHIKDSKIQKSIYNQYYRLVDNLEYHLLGNHLMENAFSLLFGAYYFQNNFFYHKAKKILEEELKEQVLNDGAHFELSPMYQQIILDRLLDCITFVEMNPWKEDTKFLQLMKTKAGEMLNWLNKITFKNGDIPMVNDSSFDIAPKTKVLQQYANSLGVLPITNELNQSGYRKIVNDTYELLIDVGEIGPSYQPGHAHADTFSFVLYANSEPFVVDPGVSTYNMGEIRERERATSYHNTVSIYNKNSSQVWAGFRVANRAKVSILKDQQSLLKASHNGFKKLGFTHMRTFEALEKKIVINDQISDFTQNKSKAFLHFHPNVSQPEIQEDSIHFTAQKITIKCEGASSIELEEYKYALGFNRTQKAYKIILTFDNRLQTVFSI